MLRFTDRPVWNPNATPPCLFTKEDIENAVRTSFCGGSGRPLTSYKESPGSVGSWEWSTAVHVRACGLGTAPARSERAETVLREPLSLICFFPFSHAFVFPSFCFLVLLLSHEENCALFTSVAAAAQLFIALASSSSLMNQSGPHLVFIDFF